MTNRRFFVSDELRPVSSKNVEQYLKAARYFNNWPTDFDCDGLLWAGLAKFGLGPDISLPLTVARDDSGNFHRRPLIPYGPCNKNGIDCGSKSSLSTDMLYGLMHGCLENEISILDEYLDTVQNNFFLIGKPYSRLGEVLIKPNAYGLLRQACGKAYPFPYMLFSGGKDYVTHLTALAIYLYGRIHGFIEGSMMATLYRLREADRSNATFAAIIGRFNGGIDLSYALQLNENESLPTYVRGNDNYQLVYKIFNERILSYVDPIRH